MQIASKCGVIGDIRWYGWKEKPWNYASEADAFVMASAYEGFPLAAIEAQANGIPVISTPVNGLVDLIKPGINGFLYPFDDVGALIEILNAISSGALPTVCPENCKKAVADFQMECALADFESKLLAILDNIAGI